MTLPTTDRKDSYIYIYQKRYLRVQILHSILHRELAAHDGGNKINKRRDEEHLYNPSW